jgi:hypothetical protein
MWSRERTHHPEFDNLEELEKEDTHIAHKELQSS